MLHCGWKVHVGAHANSGESIHKFGLALAGSVFHEVVHGMPALACGHCQEVCSSLRSFTFIIWK